MEGRRRHRGPHPPEAREARVGAAMEVRNNTILNCKNVIHSRFCYRESVVAPRDCYIDAPGTYSELLLDRRIPLVAKNCTSSYSECEFTHIGG